jgi:cell division septal protein FtsQ
MNIKKILNLENIVNVIFTLTIITFSVYSLIHLLNTPIYKINDINISGNEFLNNDNITSLIKHKIKDKNIYNVPIKELNELIVSHEFIKTSKIFTISPSTISIIVNEVSPILLFQKNKDYYLIDNHYTQIKADIKSINHYSVPIISNYEKFDNEYKRIVNSLNYIIENNKNIYSGINEIKVVNNELFYFIKNKATIKLSIDNIENNTIKLIEFDKQLNSEYDIRSYKNIDLTIPNQIIVKEKTI